MISIAMATYNGEAYIRQQLSSILEQTMQADEIIICDDCSTDLTVSVIREFMAQYPDRGIHLVENKENLGYIANFQQAIRMTQGDYIFLADQDDIWHRDKLKTTLQAMQEMGASLVCTSFRLINSIGDPIEDTASYDIHPFVKTAGPGLTPITFHRLIFGNIVQGCTYCFTSAVRDVYLNVNSLRLVHDHQLMFAASLVGTVYFLNEALIDYRLHGSNAIGFAAAAEQSRIRLKKPSRKPLMVLFLDELSQGIHVPYKAFYQLLYYLRIPYFVSVLRRKRNP